MKLSRTIAYAVRATLELVRTEPNCPIPGSELANRENMPEQFLLQILHRLVSHGVLCSAKGMAGGYYLARAPDEITLLDIVEAFENPLHPTVPELPGVPAHVRERLMASVKNTYAAACQELNKLTLADLARSPRDRFEALTD